MGDILHALRFNRDHSGDAIARVYFGQAADEIVMLRRERDSLRRRLAVECAANRHIAVEAEALERALAISLNDMDHP